MPPSDHDNGQPLGVHVPGMPAAATPPDANDTPAGPAGPIEARPGDTGLGYAAGVAADGRELTEVELDLMRRAEEDLAMAEVERVLSSPPGVLKLPSLIASPLLLIALLGSAGVLGLFVFSQTMSLLADLANQPSYYVRVGGYGLIGVLVTLVVAAVGRLAVLYARLKRNEQVPLKAFEELAERTNLRQQVHLKKQEARKKLDDYLESYPLTPSDSPLKRLGMTEEDYSALLKAREELADDSRLATTDIWFAEFAERFQSKLDGLAAERVGYWARRNALVTAISPNGLVDTASVMYLSFSMVGDLCRIYNLRAGRSGTAGLLIHVFFNAYLAGQLNDLESLTEEGIREAFAGEVASQSLTSTLLAKFSAKAASGAANYYLLRRLGRFVMRLLQPVGVRA